MKINQVIETKDGTYSFDGDVTPEEHAALIEAGFKLLFSLGLLSVSAEKMLNESSEDIPTTGKTLN